MDDAEEKSESAPTFEGKLKPTQYYLDKESRDGHDVTIAEVDAIRTAPLKVVPQTNGWYRVNGAARDKFARTILKVEASGGQLLTRIGNAFFDRNFKK
jgi:hypothetical protein